MRSLLIEFHCFGKLTTGLLREGDSYLIAMASRPVLEIKMPLEYVDFVKLMKALRYEQGPDARKNALKDVSETVTNLLQSKVLHDLCEGGEFPLQLDLVANAAELSALPFEAAVDGNNAALLAGKNPIVLTRRVRGDFAETSEPWPAKARILFAWACPKALRVTVPYPKHELALRKALSSWIPLDGPSGTQQDISSVLEVVPGASLDSIREACQRAVERKKPFTHVHLLAHGYPVGEGIEQMFGLALHSKAFPEEVEAATPEAIALALEPLRGLTKVLSFAACDSGNEANTIIPRRSIAHEMHVRGIPVVIASQFPLTVAGSTILIETFYRELLAGQDVRMALHTARCALFNNQENARHDWASVVAYVRLPEGYAEHLPAVRLEAVLTSLKAVQSWSDDLIKSDTVDPARFERLADMLRGNLKRLESFLDGPDKLPPGVREENLGLLGSAEKRLAELYFECGQRSVGDGWKQPMLEALERSRTWYRKGFDSNLSHHWTGVQFLSLEAVLSGKVQDPNRWSAAVLAAQLSAQKDGEIWAWGSLAELYLIASAAGLGFQMDRAERAILELKDRVAKPGNGDRFPLESMARQLRRYSGWWTAAHGFVAVDPELSSRAAQLADILELP